MQWLVVPTNETYLLDVHTLGEKVFSTPGTNNQTFKHILESASIPKVFLDVRDDSDALFSHFDINLAGVVDLQLMELATRTFQKRHVNGLSKCIKRDLQLSFDEKQKMKSTKETGLNLFAPGGSYEVFNARSLHENLLYCCRMCIICRESIRTISFELVDLGNQELSRRQ